MTADPIKIFVGCASNNEDLESQAVLEWSIRKHTQRELQITWMQQSRNPNSPFYADDDAGWQTQPWTTPFSGFRWIVPYLCDFKGSAIYSDSDVMYLGDVGELWDEPIDPGKVVIAKGGVGKDGQRYCVSKWDCAAVMPHLPTIAAMQRDPASHRRLMQWWAAHPQLVQTFENDWNCLDGHGYASLSDPRLRAIHFTGIPTQPQLRYAVPRLRKEGKKHWYTGSTRQHPRADLLARFDMLLAEATTAGYGIERYRKEPYGAYSIRSGR